MPLFGQTERSAHRDSLWSRTTTPKDFCDPEYLWGRFYNKFNIVTIPIFDDSAFLAEALDAAEWVADSAELEDLMERRFHFHRKDYFLRLRQIAYRIGKGRDTLSSATSRAVASQLCETGCLDDFMHFVGGVALGWPNEATDEQLGTYEDEHWEPRLFGDYECDPYSTKHRSTIARRNFLRKLKMMRREANAARVRAMENLTGHTPRSGRNRTMVNWNVPRQ